MIPHWLKALSKDPQITIYWTNVVLFRIAIEVFYWISNYSWIHSSFYPWSTCFQRTCIKITTNIKLKKASEVKRNVLVFEKVGSHWINYWPNSVLWVSQMTFLGNFLLNSGYMMMLKQMFHEYWRGWLRYTLHLQFIYYHCYHINYTW